MRVVVAIGTEEPFSVAARLVAYGAYGADAGHRAIVTTLSANRLSDAVELRAFNPSPKVAVVDLSELEPKSDDIVVFSDPKVHHIVQARYGRVWPQFVHLVQSANVASAAGRHGYGYRLFHKPFARVAVSEHIKAQITALVGPVDMPVVPPTLTYPAQVSDPTPRDPFSIAANAFDRDISGEALDLLRASDPKLVLRVADARTPHRERMEIYRSSSVLLSSPRPIEGFCQPVVEAMAAGCAVVMAQCEASRALSEAAPALRVVTPNAASLAAAAQELRSANPAALCEQRSACRQSALAMRTEGEREATAALFAGLVEKVAA